MRSLPENQLDEKEFPRALAEHKRRREDGVRIYRPRPEVMPFHLSKASERMVRGGVRSGKTTATIAEVSSAGLGIPLTGWDGKQIPFQYPDDRPLTIWVIGYDQGHISRLHKKFFRPGLFKIIQDRKTGQWRTWKPWEPDDAARESSTKPSPPMIPPRAIEPKGWAWEHKARRVFKICRLKNGTVIEAFPSGGNPGQGEAVDIIFIDEDIEVADHIDEWQSRLIDVGGRLIWSAWPHTRNDAIHLMFERAAEEAQKNPDDPDVFEIVLAMSGNPYLPEREREKRRKGWLAKGLQVLRSRDYGEFATDNVLVFPEFNRDTHGLPSAGEPDDLEQLLAGSDFRPPDNWTWYLALDPGHQHLSTLRIAVPPPGIGDYVVVADEIYLEQAVPDQMAEQVAARSMGIHYQAFVMDWRAARQTQASGRTAVDHWSEVFRKHGLKSEQTDHDFVMGSDNITERNMVVRNWLTRKEGGPKLRVVVDNCPNLLREFNLYKKKVAQSDVKDDVVAKQNHSVDALGYFAAEDDFVYVAPPVRTDTDLVRGTLARLLNKERRDDQAIYMGAGAAPKSPMLTL